jgi:hypothetical protein
VSALGCFVFSCGFVISEHAGHPSRSESRFRPALGAEASTERNDRTAVLVESRLSQLGRGTFRRKFATTGGPRPVSSGGHHARKVRKVYTHVRVL